MDVSELDGCGEVIELDGCTRDVFKKMRLDECMDFTEKGGKNHMKNHLQDCCCLLKVSRSYNH